MLAQKVYGLTQENEEFLGQNTRLSAKVGVMEARVYELETSLTNKNQEIQSLKDELAQSEKDLTGVLQKNEKQRLQILALSESLVSSEERLTSQEALTFSLEKRVASLCEELTQYQNRIDELIEINRELDHDNHSQIYEKKGSSNADTFATQGF